MTRLNTVLTVISLIIYAINVRKPQLRLNTVLTVISLIVVVRNAEGGREMSQYRSHGYLFNQKLLFPATAKKVSQYRSHGYLFNRF